jgi:hypothetical protein
MAPDYTGSGHEARRQYPVRPVTPQVDAVEQPVQLIDRQFDDLVAGIGLGLETLGFQSFEPETETVAFPVEDLDLATGAIEEHEQHWVASASKVCWILATLMFDEDFAGRSVEQASRLKALERKIEVAVSDKQLFIKLASVFLGLGICGVFFGFRYWHKRIQQLADQMAVTQLELARLQLLLLKADLKAKGFEVDAQ